jgi:glyoxylate reductase
MAKSPTSRLPKVVLTYPFHPKAIREELEPHADVVVARSRSSLLKSLQDADALITLLSDRVDGALLAQAPRLRVVANYAVGIDNIDLKACAQAGVRVANTPEVLSRATAELALALLLAAARRIPEGEELCRTGRFEGWAPDMLLGLELRGRTAVLVGKGRIGKETARLFRGIGLRVEWITRRSSASEISRKLMKAQILSLHMPLKPETRHWLSRARLKLLPRDAIVINTTRGPTVDENALIEALEKRRIFAAGLDVFEQEPWIPPRLRKLPNAVLLPHLGSATEQTREAMARLAISGVLGILNGKHPWNEVKFPSSGL